MKKLIVLIAFFSFALTTQAQLFNIGRFPVGYLYVGPKLGGNASFNTTENSFFSGMDRASTGVTTTSNFGYQLGGVAKLGFTDRFSIEPELVYTSKGYATNDAFDNSVRENYKYFGIPVVAKYAFVAFSNISIYGSGGFYTDILTGVTNRSVYIGDDATNSPDGGEDYVHKLEPEIISDNFNRVDFGFNVGIGGSMKLKNKDRCNVDIRTSFGTVDVNKSSSNVGATSSSSSKNITVQMSAVYLFNLSKYMSKE